MRTAITLLRDKAGKWTLKHGPDVDPATQKAEFTGRRHTFPKDATAILFAPSHGPFRLRDLDKVAQHEANARAEEAKAQKQIDDAEKARKAHAAKTTSDAKAGAKAAADADAADLEARKGKQVGFITHPPSSNP